MKYTMLFILVIFIAVGIPMALAENAKTTEEAPAPSQFDQYWEKLSEKFDFGTTNFLIGWTAILTEPADHCDKTMSRMNRTKHLFGGLGQGAVNSGLNTAGGFLNIVTAPIPQFKIPLPKNGVDVKRVAG